jgi:hypothetical protein
MRAGTRGPVVERRASSRFIGFGPYGLSFAAEGLELPERGFEIGDVEAGQVVLRLAG